MSSPLPNIAANLARTLFQGNANDVVATPDVYGVSSNAVINSSVGKFNSFDGGLLGNLRSGSSAGGLLGTITSLVSGAAGGLLGGIGGSLGGSLGGLGSMAGGLTRNVSSLAGGQYNLQGMSSNLTGNVTARLGTVMGQPLSSLSSPMQRGMNQSLGGLGSLFSGGTSILSGGIGSIGRSFGLSSLFSTIATTIGGVTQNISTDDVLSAVSAFSLVNQLTGDRSAIGYVDVGPSTMVMTSLTGTLIGLGLGLAVNKLVDSSPSESVTKAALAANVGAAIQASDLDTLQLCINKLGVGGVLSQVPNAALLLVQRYRLPTGCTVAGYPAQWTKLKGLIMQLDPQWETSMRAGQPIESLAYFTGASAAALTLMKTDSAYLIPSLIGPSFPSTDALTALRMLYPDMTKL